MIPRKTLTLYSLMAARGDSGSARWLFEEGLMNSCVMGQYVVRAGQLVLHSTGGGAPGFARPGRVGLDRTLRAQQREAFFALAVRPLAQQQAFAHLEQLVSAVADERVQVCREEAEEARNQSGQHCLLGLDVLHRRVALPLELFLLLARVFRREEHFVWSAPGYRGTCLRRASRRPAARGWPA